MHFVLLAFWLSLQCFVRPLLPRPPPSWVQDNSRIVCAMDGTGGCAPDLLNLSGEKDLAVGDLDRDGDLDVIVAMKAEVSPPLFVGLPNLLLLNNGGSFEDYTRITDFGSFASASRDAEIFDADGDGWLDVIFANTGTLHPSASGAPSQPRLHRNLGVNALGVWQGLEEVPRSTWLEFKHYSAPVPNGTLLGTLSYMDPAPRFCAVTSGDVDKDGDKDLFFVDYENDLGHRYLVNESTPGNFRFVDGTDDPNGVSSVWPPSDQAQSQIGLQSSPVANFTTGATMADLNLDGWLELVYFTDFLNGGARVVFTKQGVFRELHSRSIQGIYSGELTDYNGDGRIDVYFGSDACDAMMANMPWPSGGGQEPEIYLGWQAPSFAGAGLAEDFLTAGSAGCVQSADLDRDGLPDIGVSDIDVSANDCGSSSEPLFHILLNTTPDPPMGQPFADPDACALAVHGRTGSSGGGCSVTYTSSQPWNVNGVYDFEFIDLDKDGFQDILMGTCGGFEFWSMQGFASALNYCEAVPNSSGQAAKIGWSGLLSINSNNFILNVEGAPVGQAAQFFYGFNQVALPFGDGLRCVGGSLHRLSTFTLNSAGEGSQQLDFTQLPASSGPGQIHPDESWNFQCFFRDPIAGGAGSNYSDALSVFFLP